MCPDRKLLWFKNQLKYPTTQIKKIKTIVTRVWKLKYAPQGQQENPLPKKDKSRLGKLV
jgi:hypothetical protein